MSTKVRLTVNSEIQAIRMAGVKLRPIADKIEHALDLAGFSGFLTGSVVPVSGNNVENVVYRSYDKRIHAVTLAVKVDEQVYSCKLALPDDILAEEVRIRLDKGHEVSDIDHSILKLMIEASKLARIDQLKLSQLQTEKQSLENRLAAVRQEIASLARRSKTYQGAIELSKELQIDDG